MKHVGHFHTMHKINTPLNMNAFSGRIWVIKGKQMGLGVGGGATQLFFGKHVRPAPLKNHPI